MRKMVILVVDGTFETVSKDFEKRQELLEI